MRFDVRVSHTTAGAVLSPFDPTVTAVTLGSGQGYILPLFPDNFGQLVAVMSVPIHHDEMCGSGFGGPVKQHIIAPFRPVSIRYCGLARLADEWTGEPVVAQLHTLLESGEKPALSPRLTLSQVLYTLFRTTYSERVTLFVGVQDVLSALQSVDGQLTVSGPPLDRLMQAIIELRVSPRELDAHWPGATQWVTHAFEAHVSQQADRATRLKRAAMALLQAVAARDAAQNQHDQGAQALDSLQASFTAWSADLASASMEASASK